MARVDLHDGGTVSEPPPGEAICPYHSDTIGVFPGNGDDARLCRRREAVDSLGGEA